MVTGIIADNHIIYKAMSSQKGKRGQIVRHIWGQFKSNGIDLNLQTV